jgi:Asp-tRNA(Asn)/Glu-tRNA(Gln) amidotransferase A subunit family amidase
MPALQQMAARLNTRHVHRSGVIPLDSTSDMAGPMARTVEDCVRVLEVTVGVDPADNLTTLQLSNDVPGNYTQFLDSDGLQVFSLSLEQIENKIKERKLNTDVRKNTLPEAEHKCGCP